MILTICLGIIALVMFYPLGKFLHEVFKEASDSENEFEKLNEIFKPVISPKEIKVDDPHVLSTRRQNAHAWPNEVLQAAKSEERRYAEEVFDQTLKQCGVDRAHDLLKMFGVGNVDDIPEKFLPEFLIRMRDLRFSRNITIK